MPYQYPIGQIATMVCQALDRPTTEAGVRSLESYHPTLWSPDELESLLSARDIRASAVNDPNAALDRLTDGLAVVVLLTPERAWIAGRDRLSGVLRSRCTDGGAPPLTEDGFRKIRRNAGEGLQVLLCSTDAPEELAVVPGIERHWFWSTLWQNRSAYLQSGVAALLTNVFAVGTSLFSMIVYNRIIPSNAIDSLLVLVTGVLLLIAVDHVTRRVRSQFLSHAGLDSDMSIADRLFAQVMDLQFKSRKGSVGALASTLKEFEHIREFFASAALVSLIDVPFALVFVGFMIYIGGWMVVPVLAGMVVIIGATLYLQPRMQALARHSFEDGQSKHSVLVESITGLETLKLLGAGGFMRRRFQAVLERQAGISEQTKDYSHFSTNLSQTVQQIVQMSVVAMGAWLVHDGQFGYGAIIACTILAGKAVVPITQLSQLLVRINQIRVSYEALDELMRQPVEHPIDRSFLPRGRLAGSLEFRNVTFTYPGAPAPALTDVSFSIKPGERVAILGQVGSGKTTLSRLIAGLYQPDEGKILIDGIDQRQIAPADLRENLGIVLQDIWLMSISIETNISLGAIDLGPEQILEAARIAGVADFVDRHPDGYKLLLRERGEGLSGGQRQAIALARAIARRPPVILLDEPTSAMDVRSEQQFVSRFKDAELPATLLVITHRTSLLSLVDRVIVMENGRITGAGTTEQFLRSQAERSAAAAPIRAATVAPAA